MLVCVRYIDLLFCTFSACFLLSCQPHHENKVNKQGANNPYLLVLGTVQDAGSPQIACKRSCCQSLFTQPDQTRKVTSLGIIDPSHNKKYIFEASPDITSQCKNLLAHSYLNDDKEIPDAFFVSHAHIGHYSGLIYLGKEAMNAIETKVYVQPRMKNFLETNGPWDQLLKLKNIKLQFPGEDNTVQLSPGISVKTFTVPHRDEYSETAGFIISGPSKKVLFIPDIDKWQKWDHPILDLIQEVDIAFIDGTFYSADEIGGRNIAEIPHPFIIESMLLFEKLPAKEKLKIHFIHLNHTNPALNPNSAETHNILEKGFKVARLNDRIDL